MDKPTEGLQTTKDRIDLLYKIIQRFDFYINSTNAKASLIIAWNGVVIGAILLKYGDILSGFPESSLCKLFVIVLLISIGIAAAVSNYFVFRVVFPFLEKTSKASSERGAFETESMFFFQSASSLAPEQYYLAAKEASDNELLRDLSDQIVTVARGLSTKMELLKISIWFVVGELIALVLVLGIKLAAAL